MDNEQKKGGRAEIDGLVDEDGQVLPLETIEMKAILLALEQSEYCVTEAAKRLRIGRATMYRKLARLGWLTEELQVARRDGSSGRQRDGGPEQEAEHKTTPPTRLSEASLAEALRAAVKDAGITDGDTESALNE